MAALSALRNRNSQRMRQGFETFLANCVEKSDTKDEVDLEYVIQTMTCMNVKFDQKELAKLQKISTNNKISRDDFIQFAKSSKAVKALVEKQTKVSMKEMERSRSQKNIKIDKALAAFKALDADNSGYLDRLVCWHS